jgi:hypothetical protein
MRQPALSGPESRHFPASLPGAITKGIGIPPLDRHPFPVYVQIQPKPIPCLSHQSLVLPSRRPSEMDMPRAHSALCAAKKRQNATNSIRSHSTSHQVLFARGGGAVRVRTDVFGGSHRFRPMSKWVIAPFSFPRRLLPQGMISSSSIRRHNFLFSTEKKTGLEDVERDAAIRVTSKPKERHASITARLIRNMHVNTYNWGISGRKEAGPRQARKEMRQIKSGQ